MLWAGGTLILYPKTFLEVSLEPKAEFFPCSSVVFRGGPRTPREPLETFSQGPNYFHDTTSRQHLPLLFLPSQVKEFSSRGRDPRLEYVLVLSYVLRHFLVLNFKKVTISRCNPY